MRLETRCWVLSLLFAAQFVFGLYYVLVRAPLEQHAASPRSWEAISFVQLPPQPHARLPAGPSTTPGHFPATPIRLSSLQLDRRKYFGLFNTSACFLPGTDVRFSRRFSACQCLGGWHGSDCGLPEVMWRAARHKELPQRRVRPRRLVTCIVSPPPSTLTEIIIQELAPVVNLFVVAQVNTSQPLTLPSNLQKRTLKLTINDAENINWNDIRLLIPDLMYDDLLVFISDDQIPNSKALLFFKLYDGWQQPIRFRLRWSVYGFFWQHPTRTILGGVACTAGVLAKQYRDNISRLQQDSVLVVGDLNHFGGWQCSWCLPSPQHVIARLQAVKPAQWQLTDKTVDTAYVQELIGNGLWVDGKTQLLRTSPSQDPTYFAPHCVLNSTSKYDYLVQNMYAQMDY